MNLIEIRQLLHNLCEEAGSIRAWAKKNKIDHSYAASVKRGDVEPSRRILKAMGKRRAFNDKKTTVMKFEDID